MPLNSCIGKNHDQFLLAFSLSFTFYCFWTRSESQTEEKELDCEMALIGPHLLLALEASER